MTALKKAVVLNLHGGPFDIRVRIVYARATAD